MHLRMSRGYLPTPTPNFCVNFCSVQSEQSVLRAASGVSFKNLQIVSFPQPSNKTKKIRWFCVSLAGFCSVYVVRALSVSLSLLLLLLRLLLLSPLLPPLQHSRQSFAGGYWARICSLLLDDRGTLAACRVLRDRDRNRERNRKT